MGAPRIHGDLLKLGFEVSQSSVANTWSGDGDRRARGGAPFCAIMPRTSPRWICFVVPTIGFELLYAFVIVRLNRRDLIWIDVTRHPTAEWIAR